MPRLNSTTKADLVAAFNKNVATINMLLYIDVAGGIYVTNAYQDINYNNRTYKAIGGFIGIGDIEESAEMVTTSLTVNLSGIPDNSKMTEEIAKDLKNYNYAGATVKVYLAFSSIEGKFIDAFQIFEGIGDTTTLDIKDNNPIFGLKAVDQFADFAQIKEPLSNVASHNTFYNLRYDSVTAGIGVAISYSSGGLPEYYYVLDKTTNDVMAYDGFTARVRNDLYDINGRDYKIPNNTPCHGFGFVNNNVYFLFNDNIQRTSLNDRSLDRTSTYASLHPDNTDPTSFAINSTSAYVADSNNKIFRYNGGNWTTINLDFQPGPMTRYGNNFMIIENSSNTDTPSGNVLRFVSNSGNTYATHKFSELITGITYSNNYLWVVTLNNPVLRSHRITGTRVSGGDDHTLQYLDLFMEHTPQSTNRNICWNPTINLDEIIDFKLNYKKTEATIDAKIDRTGLTAEDLQTPNGNPIPVTPPAYWRYRYAVGSELEDSASWNNISDSNKQAIKHTITGLNSGSEYTFQCGAYYSSAFQLESGKLTVTTLE